MNRSEIFPQKQRSLFLEQSLDTCVYIYTHIHSPLQPHAGTPYPCKHLSETEPDLGCDYDWNIAVFSGRCSNDKCGVIDGLDESGHHVSFSVRHAIQA